MKRIYEDVQIEIIEVSDVDILTTSNGSENGFDTPEDPLGW